MSISIWELAERVERLNFNKLAEAAINENADRAEELNREQLNAGVLADGSLLPDYSAKTVREKRKKNQQTFPMNLHDEGGFWGGITFKARGGTILSESTDSKYTILVDRFSKEITGLNNTGMALLKPYTQKSFNNLVAKEIFR